MNKIAAMVGAPDLGTDTLAVYSGALAPAFARLAELGYDGVEIMTRDPRQLDGTSMRRWLDECGLELVGLCTGHVFGEDGLGLVGPDPSLCRQAADRLRHFVDFAAEHFGEGCLVTIGRSRGPGHAGDAERTLNEMAEAFRQLADYASPAGIQVVLEPINVLQAPFINTTQDGIAMVKRVNRSNFGLMLDVYHINIEDVDIYDSIREAADLTRFVHFCDNNRKWPGSAHLDFRKIIDVLNQAGYDGYVSLEILPWPDPDTAAESSIRYLRQFMPKAQ